MPDLRNPLFHKLPARRRRRRSWRPSEWTPWDRGRRRAGRRRDASCWWSWSPSRCDEHSSWWSASGMISFCNIFGDSWQDFRQEFSIFCIFSSMPWCGRCACRHRGHWRRSWRWAVSGCRRAARIGPYLLDCLVAWRLVVLCRETKRVPDKWEFRYLYPNIEAILN